MTKRQESALATRQKLIEAVRSLLCEKSANELNIEEIAERAGVAKGTFYVYFRRKEDVISVIAMEQYKLALDSITRSSDGAFECVSKYLKISAEIITGNTLQIAQQWLKSVSAPLDGENSGTDKYTFDREIIEKLLGRSIKNDDTVKLLSEEIMNEYYGAVAVWCITRGEIGLIKSIDDYCENGLKMLLDRLSTD